MSLRSPKQLIAKTIAIVDDFSKKIFRIASFKNKLKKLDISMEISKMCLHIGIIAANFFYFVHKYKMALF